MIERYRWLGWGIAILLLLSSCTARSATVPTTTPVTQASKLTLPFAFRAWQYQPTQMLLYNELDLTLSLYDWQTEKRLELPVHNLEELSQFAQAPQSNLIAFTIPPSGEIHLYDMRENVEYPLVQGTDPAFDATGQHLGYWAADNSVLLTIGLENFEYNEFSRLKAPAKGCCIAWNPTQVATLAFLKITGDGYKQIIELDTAHRQEKILAAGRFVGAPSWHPNGRYLLFRNQVLAQVSGQILDVETGCSVSFSIPHFAPLFWDPTGEWILLLPNSTSLQRIESAGLLSSLASPAATCPIPTPHQ
jgi:hypothetical protein